MTKKKVSRLSLSVLSVRLGICRLPADVPVPSWAKNPGIFYSITRTADELSIVCGAGRIPVGVRSVKGWRAIKVHGPLDFSLTGILASLAAPLARNGISIFTLSTFDTDYILVRDKDIEKALKILARRCNILPREPRCDPDN